MIEKISNAVVLHGPGRSGTTLLSQILSTHSALAWISGWVNRFPTHPVLAGFNRVMAIDAVERFSRSQRFWPRPAEAYKFWDCYFPGFSEPETRGDKTPHDRPEECITAIRRVLRFHGNSRFITKITGAPRARELAAVFDNPHVVYIHRDPRAVVASYHKQRWGYRNAPDRFAQRTEIELLAEYVKRYQASFEGRDALKSFQLSDVLYEEMVDEPDLFFRKLLSRLGLPHEPIFLDRLRSWKMDRKANQTWRNQLSNDGIAFLDDSLKEHIAFTSGLRGRDL